MYSMYMLKILTSMKRNIEGELYDAQQPEAHSNQLEDLCVSYVKIQTHIKIHITFYPANIIISLTVLLSFNLFYLYSNVFNS